MDSMDVSCNCGAVKVSLTGWALQQFYCHCDDCQRETGAYYIGVALFPAEAAVVQGVTETRTLRAMPRYRCGSCGTQLYGVPDPALIGIRADRLPPGTFRPAFHIHCRHAHLPVKDALPHYAGLPPEFGGDDSRVDW